MPGLSGRADDLAPGVRHRALELAPDRVGLVEDVDGALVGRRRRRHAVLRDLQVHDARAHRGDAVLGHDEHLAEAGVEAARDLPHELDVLALVVADGDLVGAVGEDVGGLEQRIEEQPRAHPLAVLGRLLLELGHAVEVAPGGDAREEPAQLGVLGHVALAEEQAAIGLQARGQQDGRRVVGEARAARRGRRAPSCRAGRRCSRSRARPGPGPRRTGGSPRCSCPGACGPWAGCRRR